MRFCRFGNGRIGIVEGAKVRDVTAALDVLPAYHYPLPTFDVFIANLDAIREPVNGIVSSAPSLPLSGLKLLSPVANPGKIVAAPVNYQKHLDEVKGDEQLHQNNQAHTITIQKACSSKPPVVWLAPEKASRCAIWTGATIMKSRWRW